ncbi:Beta-1,3-N-acetylgalactosaminyltransferase 2 [Seminavis robusta]|uniref:Hexosyltransferase n=1 Tax=Seminavis robusta TaxID=568900 RepID=A0A9N8HGU9_9STRA|nr:Beta-1,3-N-acetylgalactosaminyltransferase 2 [Seminavis robusta]|eukprot:Sro504_g155990.1 Beta-1,3-N-acetylgalactosaminyltransferase 2 (460) ;mRNA; r:34365-35744
MQVVRGSRPQQYHHYPAAPLIPTQQPRYHDNSPVEFLMTLRGKIYLLLILGLLYNIISTLNSVFKPVDTTLFHNLIQIPTTAFSNSRLPRKGKDPFTYNVKYNKDENNQKEGEEEEEKPFQPAPYDYYQKPVRTDQHLPDPTFTASKNHTHHDNHTNNNLLVLIMSARNNFEQRQAIRESWAKEYPHNILFVIGGPIPDEDPRERELFSKKLFHEQEQHNDLLDTLLPESYRALPYKLDYALKWIYNKQQQPATTNEETTFFHNLQWYVKVDDNVVVRLYRLQRLVLQKFNPHHPMVIGDIVTDAAKQKLGKWAEDPRYTPDFYPPWPRGASGYVVSRPVVEYIGRTTGLYYYQGEDVSFAIWLEEAHAAFGSGDLTWIHSPEFVFEEGCDEAESHIITGHDMVPAEIKHCFEQFGDTVEAHKSRIYRQEGPVKLHKNVSTFADYNSGGHMYDDEYGYG